MKICRKISGINDCFSFGRHFYCDILFSDKWPININELYTKFWYFSESID